MVLSLADRAAQDLAWRQAESMATPVLSGCFGALATLTRETEPHHWPRVEFNHEPSPPLISVRAGGEGQSGGRRAQANSLQSRALPAVITEEETHRFFRA